MEGEGPAEGLPLMLLQSIQVAQEHGNLPRALAKAGQLPEVELEYRLQLFQSLLEPLLMLVMGGLVGFTLVGTILPLLKVAESL